MNKFKFNNDINFYKIKFLPKDCTPFTRAANTKNQARIKANTNGSSKFPITSIPSDIFKTCLLY